MGGNSSKKTEEKKYVHQVIQIFYEINESSRTAQPNSENEPSYELTDKLSHPHDHPQSPSDNRPIQQNNSNDPYKYTF